MTKHLVELDDDEIEQIAVGLSNSTWIADHCAFVPGADYMGPSVKDKRLCDRLEALLPVEVRRAIWPDEVVKAASAGVPPKDPE